MKFYRNDIIQKQMLNLKCFRKLKYLSESLINFFSSKIETLDDPKKFAFIFDEKTQTKLVTRYENITPDTRSRQKKLLMSGVLKLKLPVNEKLIMYILR